MGLGGRLAVVAVVVALLVPAPTIAGAKDHDLAARVRELERQNAELQRRLERLEQSAGRASGAAETVPAGSAPVAPAPVVAAGAETPRAAAGPEVATDTTEDVGLGLIARYGAIRASFQIFGDAGFGWSNPQSPDQSNAAFALGSLDLFSSVQIGEHFQALAETVFEGDSDDNEVGVDLERLWGAWTFDDALYVKIGREHSPQSRWDRRYHHGKWMWTSATQPFLARFEDDGGPLQVHQVGLELGGRLPTRGGIVEYAAVVANGRDRHPEDVQSFGDRNDAKAYDVGLGFAPVGAPGFALGANAHFDEIPSIADDPTRRHAIGETTQTVWLEYFASPIEVLGEVAFIQHDDRTSDHTFDSRSGYLQTGYHVGAFTPYARADLRDMGRGDPFYAPSELDRDSHEGVLGVRWDLNESVALKLEGGVGREQRFRSVGSAFTATFERLAVQLAWVF